VLTSIFVQNLIEPEQKAGMGRAEFGMTERIGPHIKVAAPILERRRAAENEYIAALDDLDVPADLVAVLPSPKRSHVTSRESGYRRRRCRQQGSGKLFVAGHSRGAGRTSIFCGLAVVAGTIPVGRVVFGEPRPGFQPLAHLIAAIKQSRSYSNGKVVTFEHDCVTDMPYRIALTRPRRSTFWPCRHRTTGEFPPITTCRSMLRPSREARIRPPAS
jgi:hypothetical protein